MKTPLAVAALAALAQDTRLTVFRLLIERGPDGLHAGAIAGELGLAPATLSFHLKELASAGLVRAVREGRHVRYGADYAQMEALLGFLTRNCCRGAPCAVSAPERGNHSRRPREAVRAGRASARAKAQSGGVGPTSRRTSSARGDSKR